MKGEPEAADLLDQYLTGNGEKLQIDAFVYRTSVIVKDASEAIKDYVRHQIAKKRNFAIVSSSDPGFLHSPQADRLKHGRDPKRQGYLLPDGYLVTEQFNLRLKRANNRFILAAQNMIVNANTVFIRWSVDDTYEFESFEQSDRYTTLDLSSSKVLKLPDGLSQYLTVLGMAKVFDYWAAWTETWNV